MVRVAMIKLILIIVLCVILLTPMLVALINSIKTSSRKETKLTREALENRNLLIDTLRDLAIKNASTEPFAIIVLDEISKAEFMSRQLQRKLGPLEAKE